MAAFAAAVPSALLISPRSPPAPASDWANVIWANSNIKRRADPLTIHWRRSNLCSIFFPLPLWFYAASMVRWGRSTEGLHDLCGLIMYAPNNGVLVTWVVLLPPLPHWFSTFLPILELGTHSSAR